MIRSGEHELWDAYLVRGRARADMAALAAAMAPAREVFLTISASAAVAVRQLAAFGKAMRELEAAQRSVRRRGR